MAAPKGLPRTHERAQRHSAYEPIVLGVFGFGPGFTLLIGLPPLGDRTQNVDLHNELAANDLHAHSVHFSPPRGRVIP